MKNKCLDDFIKSLQKEVSKTYSTSIEELINKNDLSEDSLAKLIEKEVNHE